MSDDPECIRYGKPRSRHNYFGGWGYLCHNGSGAFRSNADALAAASTASLKAELERRDAKVDTHPKGGDRRAPALLSGAVPGTGIRPTSSSTASPIPSPEDT